MLKERLTLERAGLIIKEGITGRQVEQLIVYSNTDPEVISFTSDSRRFANKEAFNRWLKKGRTVFVLEDQQGRLLGIAWFGKELLPRKREYTLPVNYEEYDTTFAIRLYQKVRGRGLSLEFMTKASLLYYSLHPESRTWLEADERNLAAVMLYENFGYRRLTKPNGNGRILMG